MEPQKLLPKQKTDMALVLFRSRFTFLFLLILLVASISLALTAGIESGELPKKIASLKKDWQSLQKALEPLPTPEPVVIQTYPTPTEEPIPTDIPAQKQQTNYYYYTYPTSKPYPTVIPGRPGSKEWDEEFWRKWDEMSKSRPSTSTYSFPTSIPGAPGSKEWKENFDRKSQQMQQDFENMKKEICTKSPSLCK